MLRPFNPSLLALAMFHIGLCVATQAQEPNSGALVGFLENKGQITDQHGKPNPDVRYLFNGPGLNVQLRRKGFSYDTWQAHDLPEQASVQPRTIGRVEHEYPTMPVDFHRIDITFIGATGPAQITAGERSAEYFNYYTAALDERGATDVHHYRSVTYHDLYPGIDMVFHLVEEEGGASVEYDFVLHPGADLEQLRWRYTGGSGIDLKGSALHVGTRFGDLVEELPSSWYVKDKRRIGAAIGYAMRADGTLGLQLLGSDRAPEDATLVIDPVPTVQWSTMYGGNAPGAGYDAFHGMEVDPSGNTLAAGQTHCTNAIATSGAHQSTLAGGTDAILVKFDPSGVRLWGTYYGGTGTDINTGVSADASSNIYVSGHTSSTSGIATTGSFKATAAGLKDGYLVKFSPSGVRLWGTYYGGPSDDDAYDVVCDGAGHPVICGTTASTTGIASPGAADVTHGGGKDAFIAEFDGNGARLWATYLGGTGDDYGYATSNDGAFIYLVGNTASTSGIALGATHQTVKSGGDDGYLVKYSGLGAKLWATYYGGSALESLSAVLAEPLTGRIYIAGATMSASGIATAGSHDPTYNGNANQGDGFLAKIDNTGQREWGTYYGGTNTDWFDDIAIGHTGRIYVSGYTESSSGISTAGTPQPSLINTTSAFLIRFSTSGARIWSTYFNGSAYWMYANCAARGSIIVLGGDTRSQTTTTPGCHQPLFGGGIFDAYAVRFSDPLIVPLASETGNGAPPLNISFTPERLVIQGSAEREEGPLEIMLHDALGRMLGTWKWPDARYDLDIVPPDLTPGLYVARTMDGTRTAAFVVPE